MNGKWKLYYCFCLKRSKPFRIREIQFKPFKYIIDGSRTGRIPVLNSSSPHSRWTGDRRSVQPRYSSATLQFSPLLVGKMTIKRGVGIKNVITTHFIGDKKHMNSQTLDFLAPLASTIASPIRDTQRSLIPQRHLELKRH